MKKLGLVSLICANIFRWPVPWVFQACLRASTPASYVLENLWRVTIKVISPDEYTPKDTFHMLRTQVGVGRTKNRSVGPKRKFKRSILVKQNSLNESGQSRLVCDD